jgi:hypothetical protein
MKMTNEIALEILKDEDIMEEAVKECHEAMIDAYTRTDTERVTVVMDEDGDIWTEYGNIWTPETVTLASWTGAGADAMEEEEAVEWTYDFGAAEIEQKLLDDIRQEKMLAEDY